MHPPTTTHGVKSVQPTHPPTDPPHAIDSNVAKERLSIILAHQRLSDVNIQQLQVRTSPWSSSPKKTERKDREEEEEEERKRESTCTHHLHK